MTPEQSGERGCCGARTVRGGGLLRRQNSPERGAAVTAEQSGERGCCDAGQRAPAPTGNVELKAILATISVQVFVEVADHFSAGADAGAETQSPQPRTGLHQAAAVQRTHQPPHICSHNC